jgi:predicted nuclease of predicted toxin-antitoxin system
MKILLDMNISPQWVEFFQSNSFEALHWSAVGNARATDREIFEYAATNGFVVMTHDLDFGQLLWITNSEAPSVFQIRINDILPDSHGEFVLKAIQNCLSDLEFGALVVIDESNLRIRSLPLRIN